MKTLFVGRGDSGVCWYRCALPALALGADWLGVIGEPGTLQQRHRRLRRAAGRGRLERTTTSWSCSSSTARTGWIGSPSSSAPASSCSTRSTTTSTPSRPSRATSSPPPSGPHRLRAHEAAMRACDGLICSTAAVADRYAALNERSFVCPNGIDLPRYPYPRRARDTVTIGWAGGTGHERAVRPWLREVAAVLAARRRTRACGPSASRSAASSLQRFGTERASAVPFAAIDTYPAAMAAFDIALAPAAPSAFFAAKSDLRFLEAAALGLPVVADPASTRRVVHGETGLHAATPDEAREHMLTLVDDAELRRRFGEAARAYVERERAMPCRRAPLAGAALLKIAAARPTTGYDRPERTAVRDPVVPPHAGAISTCSCAASCRCGARAPGADVARRRRRQPGALAARVRSPRDRRARLRARRQGRERRASRAPSTSGCATRSTPARDAVLVNADIEFHRGRLARPHARAHRHARAARPPSSAPACCTRTACIQHAGVLPLAPHARLLAPLPVRARRPSRGARRRCRCPVTAALQLIRHETLDARSASTTRSYRMCLRGRRLLPARVRGRPRVHLRALGRARSTTRASSAGARTPRSRPGRRASAERLRAKWAATDLSPFATGDRYDRPARAPSSSASPTAPCLVSLRAARAPCSAATGSASAASRRTRAPHRRRAAATFSFADAASLRRRRRPAGRPAAAG